MLTRPLVRFSRHRPHVSFICRHVPVGMALKDGQQPGQLNLPFQLIGFNVPSVTMADPRFRLIRRRTGPGVFLTLQGVNMAVDWISTLQEQAEFVTRMAEHVRIALELPALSHVQVFRLHRSVEQGASTFDRMLDEIDEDDVENDLIQAAATIADSWTYLSILTANKLRALQGLAPIELPPENVDNNI
jgi:hypothetical protein